MTLPGNIGTSVPDGPDWLVRTVRDLQREVAQLRTAIPANATSVFSNTTRKQNFSPRVAAQTAAQAMVMTQDIVVPAGFSSAVITAHASVYVQDDSPNATNTVYVWATAKYDSTVTKINAFTANDLVYPGVGGGTVDASATHSDGVTLTGLTAGQTIQSACSCMLAFNRKKGTQPTLAVLTTLAIFSR